MPTNTNNYLSDLIHSLTKSEKRYFKLYIKDNVPLSKLYDAIKSNREISDLTLITKVFPKQKAGGIAVIKNRLYNHVLRSLNQYHTEKSIDKQIKAKLQNIEILFHKGLYSQCNKLIKTSKKIALSHGLHYSYLELSKWEKQLAVQYNYENISNKDIVNIYDKDMEMIGMIQSFHKIWNIKSELLLKLYKKGKARNAQDMDDFHAIMKKMPSKELLTLDIKTEYLYNHTLSAYYFCILDGKKSYKIIKENHQLVRQNKKAFEDEPNIMLSILSNAIYLSQKYGTEKETGQYLTELEQHYAGHYDGEELELRVFTNRSISQLANIIMKSDYNSGLDLIPEIKAKLNLFESRINTTKLTGIYYSIAGIYLGLEDYSSALSWINKILNEVKIDRAEDQYCYAEMLHVIIHMELSNEDYVHHALKSLKRYLSTRNRMDEFESSFIVLISKLIKTNDKSIRKKYYSDFAEKTKQLKKNPFTQGAFEYYDFEAWAKKNAEK